MNNIMKTFKGYNRNKNISCALSKIIINKNRMDICARSIENSHSVFIIKFLDR